MLEFNNCLQCKTKKKHNFEYVQNQQNWIGIFADYQNFYFKSISKMIVCLKFAIHCWIVCGKNDVCALFSINTKNYVYNKIIMCDKLIYIQIN